MNFLFSVGLILASAPSASSKAFLDATSGSDSDTDLSDIMAVLLTGAHPLLGNSADLSESVRDQHAKDEHARNQAALDPMFKSLPKNEKGNLPLPAARYALHRLFEHRHRWFVRGLHPNMGNKSAARSHSVGQALHTMTALDSKGLTLPGLAALAGTLEQLIQKEMETHLLDFFTSEGFSFDEAISGDTLARVVESYMIVYISGADFRKFDQEDVKQDDDFMAANTKDWTETKEWVRSTTRDAAKKESGCTAELRDCQFHFAGAARVVRAVVQKYGYFNDRQCHQVKGKLLDMSERRTGRVTLADFYNAGLSSTWQFNEKVDYLRSLGTLDESEKDSPKVLVPNYVSSWVNCLSPSKFYAVCCRNECEDYMQVIEKRVDGAMADPDDIIRLVETHSVFTEDAPHGLSKLRHRLVSIAERHRGKVPIHGRLFAQWMHHAFPATCPYPHEMGTTDPQTPDEWMSQTGHADIKASDDEVQEIVSRAKESIAAKLSVVTSKDEPTEEAELPWTDVEELLVVRPSPRPQSSGKSFVDRFIVFMEGIMVVALVGTMIWMAADKRNEWKARSKGHHS